MTRLDAQDLTTLCLITSTHLLSANARRKWVVLVNQGTLDVWLMLGGPGVANRGIYLKAGGGAFAFDMVTSPWYGAIDGIAVGGDSVITILEVEGRE